MSAKNIGRALRNISYYLKEPESKDKSLYISNYRIIL